MGAVYVVEQISTGKARALKVMHPDIARDEDCRRRFVQEARISGRVDSDHVVEVHSAGVDAATRSLFLVMELLEGENLAERIARDGALSLEDARVLFTQLCHAVGAAHAAGIVHRDLKPENVFLARSKRAGESGKFSVKVLDFGIAKLVAEAAPSGRTTGMIGTPMWMAPEQTEPGPVTARADVWALGLILYYVLTGRCFWRTAHADGVTFAHVLREMLVGDIPALSLRAAEDGARGLGLAAFDDVFAVSVERDVASRLPDANRFGDAVEQAMSRALGGGRDSSPAISAPAGSVRVVAEADARALDATVGHAGPVGSSAKKRDLELDAVAPGPALELAAPPRVAPPASSPRPVVLQAPPSAQPERSAFATVIAARSAPPPIWVFVAGVIVLLGVISGGVALNRKLRAAAAVSGDADEDAVVDDGGAASTSGPSCRICTLEVQIKDEGLDRAQLVAPIEAAFERIDRQCLTPHAAPKFRRARRGSPTERPYRPTRGDVTISLTVRDGAAVIHDVSASTVTDSSDECIADALSEVRFAQSRYRTVALYTIRYDTAVR